MSDSTDRTFDAIVASFVPSQRTNNGEEASPSPFDRNWAFGQLSEGKPTLNDREIFDVLHFANGCYADVVLVARIAIQATVVNCISRRRLARIRSSIPKGKIRRRDARWLAETLRVLAEQGIHVPVEPRAVLLAACECALYWASKTKI